MEVVYGELSFLNILTSISKLFAIAESLPAICVFSDKKSFYTIFVFVARIRPNIRYSVAHQ